MVGLYQFLSTNYLDQQLEEMDLIDGIEEYEDRFNILFNDEAEISDLTEQILKEIEKIRIFLIQIETGAKL